MIGNSSIDFILTHPPYTDIIKYSKKKIKEYLSNIYNLDIFCDEIEKVANELYRVLKKDKSNFWNRKSKEYNFLPAMYEHIFIFQKLS